MRKKGETGQSKPVQENQDQFTRLAQQDLPKCCGIALNSINLSSKIQIMLDRCATDNIFCKKYLLTNLDISKNNQYVVVANGVKIKIDNMGVCNPFSKNIKDILYKVVSLEI